MKFSYLICCLILHLSQRADGIFFSSSWLQNLLNPTTTTTASPSSAAPSQSYYNISPNIFLVNDVTAGNDAYSSAVLSIGKNITGLSRRKRSLFGQVFDTVDNGISNARKFARKLTRPLRKRTGVSASIGGSSSGKTVSQGKIDASGQTSVAGSTKHDSTATLNLVGSANSTGVHSKGDNSVGQKTTKKQTQPQDSQSNGQELTQNQPQGSDAYKSDENSAHQRPTQYQSRTEDTETNKSTSISPLTQGDQPHNQTQVQDNEANNNEDNSDGPALTKKPTDPLSYEANKSSSGRPQTKNDPSLEENLAGQGTTQSQPQIQGNTVSSQDGLKSDDQRANGQEKQKRKPSYSFSQIPTKRQQKPSNTNSSLADDMKNRASNFLSGLQDRFANSPIGSFGPVNISQGLGQHFKKPIGPISNQLNKTNFLQNFTDDVHNFVEQLANNNHEIQNFIANNNLNTSNPFQTFAQLGLNGLIPNPVETLANLSMSQLENQVKDSINNGLSDVQQGVQGVQSLGVNLANLIPNLAANAIKDIQNMIKQSGVVACVNKQPLPFSNVIQIAANASSKCVSEKVDQAASIWNETAANLQNAGTDLQRLRDSISECSQRISAGTSGISLSYAMTLKTCYAAALFNIQSETVLLPLTIGQRVAEGVGLANSLKGHMIKCVANLAQEIATQALTASQAIAKCIVDSTG